MNYYLYLSHRLNNQCVLLKVYTPTICYDLECILTHTLTVYQLLKSALKKDDIIFISLSIGLGPVKGEEQ